MVAKRCFFFLSLREGIVGYISETPYYSIVMQYVYIIQHIYFEIILWFCILHRTQVYIAKLDDIHPKMWYSGHFWIPSYSCFCAFSLFSHETKSHSLKIKMYFIRKSLKTYCCPLLCYFCLLANNEFLLTFSFIICSLY